jgi:predicted Zn-dependent peptidase
MRDEPVADEELARARAFARGRLELRLEESRHMASWLGVQEALHERVLTLDEALEELDQVSPHKIQELAARLLNDEALCLAVIGPKGSSKRLESLLKLP